MEGDIPALQVDYQLEEQRSMSNFDSGDSMSPFESSPLSKKPPTKQTFHVLEISKVVCTFLLVTATLWVNIFYSSHTPQETSLRNPNDPTKQRVLQEHTNVFAKSSTTFLVQWGTLQSGCRAPPKAHLVLECSGGELNVMQGGEDCADTLWGGAECALPIEAVESNGHHWKQGMIVATCQPSQNSSENESLVEFIASFSFDFPTVCMGQPTDGVPEDLTEWPQGNFETFLEASQLCTSDGNDMHLLEPSESFSGNEKTVRLFENTETAVYRAADTCTVPDCSLLGPGFICPPVVLPCQVNPPPLIVSHKGAGVCQQAGFEDIDSAHGFWSNSQSYRLSLTNLFEAGFGDGAGYHL